MAIKKKVVADNGVTTEYHRVALVNIDVNSQNTILIISYLSDDGRQIEKDYAAGAYADVEEDTIKFPYTESRYIHTDYDENMTVKAAYEYIKSLPEFEGSEDI
jgi:hypothetical protein